MKVFTLLLLLGSVTATAADINQVKTPQVKTPHKTSLLTVPEQQQAELWRLSEAQWLRYKQLMLGIRGAVSQPNISPLEVLGIHATNPQEREYYAQRWAQMMYEDTDRVLAFQRAYQQAFALLYPNVSMIDPSRVNFANRTPQTGQSNRFALFVSQACADCADLIKKLLSEIKHNPEVSIDIYMLESQANSSGDKQIREWAMRQSIPVNLVGQRRLTLNHDNGLLDSVINPRPALPYLVKVIDLNRFIPTTLSEIRNKL